MFTKNRTIASQPILWDPPAPASAAQKARQGAADTHSIADAIESNKNAVHRSGGYAGYDRTRIIRSGTTQMDLDNFLAAPLAGFSGARVNITIGAYQQQTTSYIQTLSMEQARLNQSNYDFLNKVHASGEPLTATALRNKGDWPAVKRLVVRQELMKLQMGGKSEIPNLTEAQLSELKRQIKGVDLSNMSDEKIRAVIDNILRPSDQTYLNALKNFQSTGQANSLVQPGKADQLAEYLKDIDLNRITKKEFKFIKDNFLEKTEVHHRNGVASNPEAQSQINNTDLYNSTQHNLKHTDPETGKIDYKKKVDEPPRDRIKEVQDINTKRVLTKALQGIGLAAAIGLGTGFAIGFITLLAQNGLNPNSIKYAFMAGAKQGTSSAGTAAASAAVGLSLRPVAENMTNFIASKLTETATNETLQNISTMCNMGLIGSLTIIAFSTYSFVKLKQKGYSTKECLLRTGKSAALSASVLVISIIAQGLWGGAAGIVVSVTAGVIMTGYTIGKIQKDKRLNRELTYYSIGLCRPDFSAAAV